MVILLLDTLLSSLASIILPNQWWRNFNLKLHPANCHYILILSLGIFSTRQNTGSRMGAGMLTLARNCTLASPPLFRLIWSLHPFQMASDLCISYIGLILTPSYWWQLWWSYGTAYAPNSLVHLTVTSSNITLALNSLPKTKICVLILPISVHVLLTFYG